MQIHNYIIWFKDIRREDNGFVVTSEAYFDFIKENNLFNKMKHLINLVDFDSQHSLDNASKLIKKQIIEGRLSPILVKKILLAYGYLGHPISHPLVAVGSSLAGQEESFLNVKGDASLILKIKEVWASLFNTRAIFYRHENKLDHFRSDIEVIVQKTVKSQVSNSKSQKIVPLENGKWQMENGKWLLRGDPASPGIGVGRVKIIENVRQIAKVKKGDVLVALSTSPDFIPGMKKAVAIVIEKEGRTSHAAIVSRQLGTPAIVGAKNALKILKNEILVTVNGTTGCLYKGIIKKHSDLVANVSQAPIPTATKVYVNLSDPSFAERTALLNADGVGLLKAEFMMEQIGVHPKRMIRAGKSSKFIEMLSDGLEKFCRAFGERIVVYRTSNLKTNQYQNLVGGRQFEPVESNPMLGYRGAFRYISDPEVFNLELAAIKRVRHLRGCTNLFLMIPFVRTVKELISVKKLISNSSLYRSESFKIWLMVEIPANVILLEKFINVGLDGVCIGLDDLTQLILGIDSDNSEVARELDEQNESVLWAIERVIKTCSKYKIPSSICGQATIYPTLLEKLVKWGITSVSVSPDAVGTTRKLIAEYEKKIIS